MCKHKSREVRNQLWSNILTGKIKKNKGSEGKDEVLILDRRLDQDEIIWGIINRVKHDGKVDNWAEEW